MIDLIKRAVELADRWTFDSDDDGEFLQPSCTIISLYLSDLEEMPETYQFYLDALAAQLVRQRYARIVGTRLSHQEIHYSDDPLDTIKDIVESGELDD